MLEDLRLEQVPVGSIAAGAVTTQLALPRPPVQVVAVVVEVLLFSTDGRRVRYEPLRAQLPAEQEPDVTARRLCGIKPTGDGLLHSTSWRFEQGAVVLTYAALRHDADETPHGQGESVPAGTDIAAGADSTAPAPDDLDLDEVAAHACRHLAFLAATDRQVAQALESFPVIERLIRRYTPDVAGRARPEGGDL